MKNDRVYLFHILEAIEKIDRYLIGKDYDDLCRDDMLFDAVIREMAVW